MATWLSYSLADFIPFSLGTYLRLFERYQADIQPLHWIGWAAGLGLLWLLRNDRGRLAALFMAGCWIWIGLVFHHGYYRELNWAAGQFTWIFVAQGILLGIAGADAELDQPAAASPALIRIAVLGHPLFAALGGHWYGTGFFATAPDPTAVATLGLALAFTGKWRWILAIIPMLWCGVGLLTAIGLGRPVLGMTAGAGLVLWILFSIWPGRHRPIE